jgi:hypothetical protein
MEVTHELSNIVAWSRTSHPTSRMPCPFDRCIALTSPAVKAAALLAGVFCSAVVVRWGQTGRHKDWSSSCFGDRQLMIYDHKWSHVYTRASKRILITLASFSFISYSFSCSLASFSFTSYSFFCLNSFISYSFFCSNKSPFFSVNSIRDDFNADLVDCISEQVCVCILLSSIFFLMISSNSISVILADSIAEAVE